MPLRQRRSEGTARPARTQLADFIAKYTPPVAAEGRAALAKMRRLVPGATELVYDNWNFLVVGFGPSERASDAVLSVAFAPRWIIVGFLQNGPALPDPLKLLRGSGTRVRNVRLGSAKDLDTAPIRSLIKAALAGARVPIRPTAKRSLIIRSISARQRPRRPKEG